MSLVRTSPQVIMVVEARAVSCCSEYRYQPGA
jgi:hypothetical protein